MQKRKEAIGIEMNNRSKPIGSVTQQAGWGFGPVKQIGSSSTKNSNQKNSQNNKFPNTVKQNRMHHTAQLFNINSSLDQVVEMTAAGSVDLLEGSNEDSQELPRT